jgi:hypothetical protein
MDVLKGIRQIFKKFEIILPYAGGSYNERNDSSEIKHFKKIPTTGTKFTPRSAENTEFRDSTMPFFFRSLEQPEDDFETEVNRADYPCFVCTHPNKVNVIHENRW